MTSPILSWALPLALLMLVLAMGADLVRLLRGAIDATQGEDGWSKLGAVGSHIGNQGSFDSRNYGYRKLSDLIEATGLFEVQKNGQSLSVRAKKTAPPRKRAGKKAAG